MSQFTVDPATLQAHAARVSGVAQAVHAAAGAGGQVGLGGDAYGELLAPIIGPVLPRLLPNMTSAIAGAADLADAMAAGLRSNSDVYQRVDDDISAALKTVDH